MELAVDAPDVHADCVEAQPECFGDFLVGGPFPEALQDLPLPRGERFKLPGGLAELFEIVNHLAGD